MPRKITQHFKWIALGLFSASLAWSNDSAVDTGHQGYFIALHGGGAFPGKFSWLLNNGYSVGGEYGYQEENYRMAVQLDYSNNTFKRPTSANYNLFDLMLNLFYDINYTGHVIPFLGGGVGYVNAWQNQCNVLFANCNQLSTGSHFGLQGIGGIGFRFNHFRLDLRYRYVTFTKNNGFYENIAEAVVSYYFLQ